MNTQMKVYLGVGLVVLVLGMYFPRNHSVINQITEQLGGSSGNEHLNIEYFLGGFTGKPQGMISTTTIACAQQNTTLATSTFEVSFKVTTATSTITVLGISTTTAALAPARATTTAFYSRTLASGKQGEGSYNGTDGQNIVGPSDWVFVGYGAGTNNGLPGVAVGQVGQCNFIFKPI